jgi:hypothetical protein
MMEEQNNEILGLTNKNKAIGLSDNLLIPNASRRQGNEGQTLAESWIDLLLSD